MSSSLRSFFNGFDRTHHFALFEPSCEFAKAEFSSFGSPDADVFVKFEFVENFVDVFDFYDFFFVLVFWILGVAQLIELKDITFFKLIANRFMEIVEVINVFRDADFIDPFIELPGGEFVAFDLPVFGFTDSTVMVGEPVFTFLMTFP